MQAKEQDIETKEGRAKSLTKLANAIFHENSGTFLNKPSRSNGTGKLTSLEFAMRGKTEFRTIENKLLDSFANIPLTAVLNDFSRFMPDMNPAYAAFMSDECHGRKYNRVLNGYDLYSREGRLECIEALYKAHGAQGIDQDSVYINFDKETPPEKFQSRKLSPGTIIKRPDHAAMASYLGLMNAVCDLFLNPAKQKPEDLKAWHDPETPDPSNLEFAA